jgi:hypothetical protein
MRNTGRCMKLLGHIPAPSGYADWRQQMMAELQRILSENPDALKGDDKISMASLFTAYDGAVNGTLFEELGKWFDLTGKIRVYDGFFRGKEEDDFRDSHYLDVAGLRSTMRELQEPLMDERLPKPFRDGVSYITDTDTIYATGMEYL